jgi:hypothetical protein
LDYWGTIGYYVGDLAKVMKIIINVIMDMIIIAAISSYSLHALNKIQKILCLPARSSSSFASIDKSIKKEK